MAFNILILGAAYGLLPALRILKSGHNVSVLCRVTEQQDLLTHGAEVVFGKGAAQTRITAAACVGPGRGGKLGLVGADVDPRGFDLIVLAMSEPQYAAPEITQLMGRVAAARRPVLSLMNMMPPPFLRRLPGWDVDALAPAYGAWDMWQQFDPDLISAASPDAQAVRLDADRPTRLTVTLGSNFKIAPFAQDVHQGMVTQLAQDVSAFRVNDKPLLVRLQAHESLAIPLAKWPMLIAGNCQCLTDRATQMRPICAAVHEDLERARALYDWTADVIAEIGAGPRDIVPFDLYARAAKGLIRPSSFARAVLSGSGVAERVDKMVQLAGRSIGRSNQAVDQSVADVDATLSRFSSNQSKILA